MRAFQIPGLAALLAAAAGASFASPSTLAAPGGGPLPAAAFSPDGRLLAVGGYREVRLLDAATGRLEARLTGSPGAVPCLAFSADGGSLAAGGGVPGRSGEVRVWDLKSRRPRVFKGVHSDVVYAVAWSPDGGRLVAGSYDKLLSLWDVSAGTHRILKDHTDSVYAVAFSPDGRRIASAAADRTVKVWDADAGRRLFTMSESTAELYALAFHPAGDRIAAAGADRMLRTWRLTAGGATLLRSAFAHDGSILRVLFSPDGRTAYTSGEDRAVKAWDADTLVEEKVFERQPDWALGLALSPDGRTLATSRYDGSLALYDTTGDHVRRVPPPLPAR